MSKYLNEQINDKMVNDQMVNYLYSLSIRSALS